jgi:putative tricarboxylic transport membrane protein
MSNHEGSPQGPRLVSTRTMEIVVALILMGVAAVVITDSLRLGMRWRAIDGPGAGYFPFYIGLLLALSSAVTLIRAVMDGTELHTFVSKSSFKRVLAVLIPLLFYILVLSFIGIYVASLIYIALFMWHFGRYPIWRGALVGFLIVAALFLMFEVYFLVPLPKGPLEEMLGY